ncbi:MAG: hypothetical protein LBB66_08025, partial [Desulfovibrio sp.]|nr:hypothetical protein [Desulfovibrio sp.]
MPMTDDQIANLYEKHFQIAPVASRTKGNDVEPVVMRSDRPAPAKVAQRYQEQLVGAGYLVEQADAYESLLTAHARRMAPLFGETPAEYLERRMAGFFGMTPEEFEANWRSGMGGALYQAAMYRSKAQSVGEFINEALAAPPAGAAPFFQQPNKFGKTVIELGSYQVRHIRNEHPDFVEWERIPEVIESGGERVEIGKNRVTGTEAFVYALSDGESTLVVVAAPDVGGKGKKDKKTRTVILTAFRENSAAVENWIANKKAAFSQSTGELLPNPDMRDVNPSGPQSGVGTSISQIDEEVNSLLGKGKSFEQPAFQGSPTRGIDSMSTDFIGTGEGAQAYGWGMYYTQSRDVGEWYRKKLSGGLAYRLTVDGDSWGVYTHDGDNASNWVWYSDDSDPPLPIADTSSAEYRALETLRKAGGDKDAAIAEVRETAEYEGIDAEFADEVINHLNNLEEAERGQLYEVEIPDDDVLLDYDKPLSEQLEHVKSALRYFADTSADVLLRKRQHPWISPIVRRALSDDW